MKNSLTDEKQNEFLEAFANEHSIAVGGGIQVTVSSGYTHYTPRQNGGGCKIEDGNFLHDQLSGATSFLYWLRRSGYTIVKEKK
jgi:hypothetical protein